MDSPVRIMSTNNSHRRKTPERTGLEMILRKSFSDSFKEYVSCSSLASVRNMSDPTMGWFLRTIWAVVFCIALGAVLYYLKCIWFDMLANPLIVTMESNTYPISSIDFPAVVICSNNRISKKALAKFAEEEYLDVAVTKSESLKEVEQALLNWGRLIDFSYNEELQVNPLFQRMVNKYRDRNDLVEQIMKMLAPPCQDILLNCSWNGAEVDCMTAFSVLRIANRGHCCTFNYWLETPPLELKRQTEAGDIYGLTLILDPMLEDYSFPLNSFQGFDVLILHPDHFADPNAGRVIQRMCEPNKAVYYELKSTKQISTNEVRKYSIENRQCLFTDEDFENQTFEVYSYSSCIVTCRIQTIYSLCKCTPYFYAAVRYFQKGPVCTLEHLKCLNKYREKLYNIHPINTKDTTGLELELEDSLFCPHCLPDCELTTYVIKSYQVPLHSPYAGQVYQSQFKSDINMTNKSFLNVYHPLPDASLDRLDVVNYWYEVLSYIGGFSGIVIGFSVITVVEIIYFLTVRFLIHFCENYKKYRWVAKKDHEKPVF